MKKQTVKKITSIIFSFIVVIIGFIVGNIFGLFGGIIGALISASYVGSRLKKMGVISQDSPLVKETKGVKIAKYVVLAIVLILIFGTGAYIILSN